MLRQRIAARPRRALVLLLPRVVLSTTAAPSSPAAATTDFCASADGPLPFTLQTKERVSSDSCWMRFGLPAGRRYLGEDRTLPTCVKVRFPNGTNEKGEPKVLEKSYSPVSHPAADGYFDLLVKAYEPRPGGGVGAYICSLEVGATMDATLKSERKMHGDARVLGRWAHVGLVAGGTGIAPLVQLARLVLEDPDGTTRVSLLSINRHEEDILMRDALDALAAAHPERFRVSYSLTRPPDGWTGHVGRGSVRMAEQALPPAAAAEGSTMIFVCGTDGFVSSWGGPVGRAPRQPDGSRGAKVQGPLLGFLADAGYLESEVFKY